MSKNDEQLAVLTALFKLIRARLDDVKTSSKADLLNAYEVDGIIKKALKINGIKVGDHTVSLTSEEWEIKDEAAFYDFALTYGFASQRPTIAPGCMLQAIKILKEVDPSLVSYEITVDKDWQKYITNTAGEATFLDSGEIVPGLRFTGRKPKGTAVHGCKPEDVVPIIRQIGGIEQLLLAQPETENQDANLRLPNNECED